MKKQQKQQPKEKEKEIPEKSLIGQAHALSRAQYKKILKQQENSLCQIITKECKGTGFLCQIPEKVLITCNHVLGENELKPEEEINIYFTDENDKKHHKTIKIDETRKIYTIDELDNELIDVTIIEIKPEDKLDDKEFLELDKYLMDDEVKNAYEADDIYIIQYKGGKEIATSDGIIDETRNGKKSSILIHTCDTDYGSSGSPIILYNHKVIGVHRRFIERENFNRGTLLQYPINEYHKLLNRTKKQTSGSSIKNNNNEINMIYKINNENKNIKILGKEFVKNNEKNCKLEINKKEYNLCEFIEFDKYGINKNNDSLNVILKGVNNITNAKDMFNECKSLQFLPDISEWDTKNVTNMNNIFGECISLESLPDISKWNIKNVTNIGGMFDGCSSLKSLPDISKWDTANVKDMNNLFRGCKSLLSLPDISKWNTKNVTDMNHIFFECSSLKSLPDISKWDTNNVKNMNNMFRGCNSIKLLPDISKLVIKNIKDLSFMFCDCSSLESLPDISKWDTKNVTNMNSMFYGCRLLKSLPDISKWDIKNVMNKESMFKNCRTDLNIPPKFKK